MKVMTTMEGGEEASNWEEGRKRKELNEKGQWLQKGNFVLTYQDKITLGVLKNNNFCSKS